MVVERGEIWWADLGESRGSSPSFERPVLIVQSNDFNKTRINTLIAAIITTNLRLAKMPGNVALSKRASGLEEESVINVSQIFTLDRQDLLERAGALSERRMEQVDEGLRLVLNL